MNLIKDIKAHIATASIAATIGMGLGNGVPSLVVPIASKSIAKNEGFQPREYPDPPDQDITCSIGFGFFVGNCNYTKTITRSEAEKKLHSLVLERYNFLDNNYPFFQSLCTQGQVGLVEAAYQLGEEGFDTFHRAIANLKENELEQAINDFKHSKWDTETPDRVNQLIKRLRSCE